jgi:hypothetical protein
MSVEGYFSQSLVKIGRQVDGSQNHVFIVHNIDPVSPQRASTSH